MRISSQEKQQCWLDLTLLGKLIFKQNFLDGMVSDGKV